MSHPTSLQSLSDDMLLLIFDYLKSSYFDQVFLGCASARLRYLFQLWVKNKNIQIKATDIEDIALPDLIEFFQLGGRYVKALTINCHAITKKSLLVEFIVEYCTNLLHLEFTNVSDNFHYAELLQRLSTLTKVTIECYDCDDVLKLQLKSNVGLETFELINGCYTGQNLCHLPNLQRLVLRDCLLWNSGDFMEPMRRLKSLELDDCSFEVTNIPLFQKIADLCTELEELTFSCCDSNYDVLANLPKLKRLTVTTWLHTNDLQSSFLIALAELKSHQLEYLKILGQMFISIEHAKAIGKLKALKELHFSNNDTFGDFELHYFVELENLEVLSLKECGNVTNVGLLHVLKQCKLLHVLDIHNCYSITDEFILEAINHRHNPSNLERRQLVINTQDSGITSEILINPAYMKVVPLIKVNLLNDLRL